MMEHNQFDEMLAQVAHAYDTAPETIREKISLAISEGQQSPDPQIRALWASVPHSGAELTLPDFVLYLAKTLEQPFEP